MTVEVTLALRGVLRTHAGGRSTVPLALPDGATVTDLLDLLAKDLPAVERRIRDETGTLRRHVNLFVDGTEVRRLGGADLVLSDGQEVLVLPAVSGG